MSTPAEICSPAVGTVLEILVDAGDRVSADDELIILESMKVEIPVTAPRDGTVEAIGVAIGDQVEEDAPLLTLA